MHLLSFLAIADIILVTTATKATQFCKKAEKEESKAESTAGIDNDTTCVSQKCTVLYNYGYDTVSDVEEL